LLTDLRTPPLASLARFPVCLSSLPLLALYA
jgi:hypothetical protein